MYGRSPSRPKDKRSLYTQLQSGTVFMKAQIYVNRQVMAANKKATKETGELVDKKAIAVNTYKGSIYCKEVKFTQGCKLIQNAEKARCSGATVWIEVNDFESLVIDGVKGDHSMLDSEKMRDLEDYFWQFVDDFQVNKDDNYVAIARRVSPKYSADKEALKIMFEELQEKLITKLNRDELELSIDDFVDLTASIIGLGKKRYYSVFENPRSAMYLTDSIKSCGSVLNLLNS